MVSDGQTEHTCGSEIPHGRLHGRISSGWLVEIRIEYAKCSRTGPSRNRRPGGKNSVHHQFGSLLHISGICLVLICFLVFRLPPDQFSRIRPKGKADNKVDIAYLYYLPFCHVFVSKDNLHKRVVPLFMRDDQSFIDADELKADLQKLDAHYSALPDEVRNSGFHKFAKYPPEDTSFL